MRKALPLLLLLAASACSPTVTGNERGGTVSGDVIDLVDAQADAQVFALAAGHCAKYGKKPWIKKIERGAGYRSALFDCT